jgi:chitodextrinase
VNARVSVPATSSLNVSSAMTLMAWIQPTAAQGGWRTILQRETDAYVLNASNSNGPLVPSGGGTLGAAFQWVSGSTASPVNAWTHVALTYDGSVLRLYVNGVQAASTPASGTVQTTPDPLWIGGNSPYGEYFQGLIDEARVYNRALSASEVQSAMNTPLTPAAPDTSPPSVPSGLSASAVSATQVGLGWSASTDNVGVTGYRIERCQGVGCSSFVQVATSTTTSLTDAGLAPSTSYSYRVRAVDAALNLSGYSNVSSATTPAAPGNPSGLVAGYTFDAGSGATVSDLSGNANTGTIENASWSTTGRYGGSMSFNGTTSRVQVPASPSLNVSTAITLMAWIRPASNQNDWRTIMQREVDAYALNASHNRGRLRPSGGATLNGTFQFVNTNSSSPVNAWTHVALTYDGSTLRLFVNGAQVSSIAASGAIETNANPLWIGGNSPYGEYFNGLIDEARVYNRALTAAEVQAAMNTPLS